jgi:hypothetical protein
MEKPMRQVPLAVFITLIFVVSTEGFSPAQFGSQTEYFATNAQEIISDQTSVLSQSIVGQYLVVAQKAAQKTSDKKEKETTKEKKTIKEKDKEEKGIPDRVSDYKCIEYCAVVRQSCEGLAFVQPVSEISSVGSKENNEWSRECQKIYNNCIRKCNFNANEVNWKRTKSK